MQYLTRRVHIGAVLALSRETVQVKLGKSSPVPQDSDKSKHSGLVLFNTFVTGLESWQELPTYRHWM
jgi:hypothetical protein